MKNLNDLRVDFADTPSEEEKKMLINIGFEKTDAKFDKVSVHFQDLESRLIELIQQYENGIIFGCVAWLTSIPILAALAKCKNVQILVQKEDFLRPDVSIKNKNQWHIELRRRYGLLKNDLSRYNLKDPIGSLSVCGDPSFHAIRCVGNYNEDRQSAFPRSHHKFLVFCESLGMEEHRVNYIPVCVWTGSFNFTKNATLSFENAVVLHDYSGKNKFLESFLFEHHRIFTLSESLNWEHVWCEPEYRIGT